MMRPTFATLTLLAVVAASAGCPGKLDHPDDFPVPCDPKLLLRVYCQGSGCHGPNPDPGQLDLLSPGVEQRLVNQLAYAEGECTNEILLDPANPTKSLFIQKILNDEDCGSVMPYSGQAPGKAEIQCLEDWALGLIAAAPEAGAGGSPP
jgi:hypothetical protein